MSTDAIFACEAANYSEIEAPATTAMLARLALERCMLSYATDPAVPSNHENPDRFVEHGLRVGDYTGVFTHTIMPQLAIIAANIHDLGDRALGGAKSSEAQAAAAHALQDYFDDYGFDSSEVLYILGQLTDTQRVEHAAGAHREALKEDPTSPLALAVKRKFEVPAEAWGMEMAELDVPRLLKVAYDINIEAVIIKAAEVIEHLEYSYQDDSPKHEVGIFREILEAESFYAPLCKIWGFDAMAMTIRDITAQIRIKKQVENQQLNSTELNALDAARTTHNQAQVFGGTNEVLGQLFPHDTRSLNYEIERSSEGKLLVDFRDENIRMTDGTELRIIGRTKSLGSLMQKYCRQTGEYEQVSHPMDVIAFTVVAKDEAALTEQYASMLDRVHSLSGAATLKPAPSKESALYAQGRPEFIAAVQAGMAAHPLGDSIQYKTQETDGPVYQVAKFTLELTNNDGVTLPVEIQFQTEASRRDARVGATSHINYKTPNGTKGSSNGSDPLTVAEMLPRIYERKGEMVDAGGNLHKLNTRSIGRAITAYQMVRELAQYYEQSVQPANRQKALLQQGNPQFS